MDAVLDRYGAVTLAALGDEERRAWATRVWTACDDFPEYARKGRKVQRVLGGFGALGNPSSFHHPTVQSLRVKLKREVSTPLFRDYALRKHRWSAKLEMLFDRVAVRCRDFGSVSKESWHRDIYDGPHFGLRPLPETDEIFGGWLNLSDTTQRFVGILESHKGEEALRAQAQGGGFATLSEADIRRQRVDERLALQANRATPGIATDSQGHILVPPGHVLIFFQRLLHCVAGGVQPVEPNLRLFVGHRLTDERTPLFPLDACLENNAVPRIPSGQLPPMYSKNHYQFFSSTPRYRTWGETTFKRQCLFERRTTKGETYYTPGSAGGRNRHANTERYMPSLVEMGFAPYSYGPAARRAMEPEELHDFGWGRDTDVIDAASE